MICGGTSPIPVIRDDKEQEVLHDIDDMFVLHLCKFVFLPTFSDIQWEPLLKDTPNKGQGTTKSFSYSANTFLTSEERTPLYNGQNNLSQRVDYIQRFHCTRDYFLNAAKVFCEIFVSVCLYSP